MPRPTAADLINRATDLIRAASETDREDEKIRYLEDAETWLQFAKHQLVTELTHVTSPSPPA
jgi:hypothetical protein